MNKLDNLRLTREQVLVISSLLSVSFKLDVINVVAPGKSQKKTDPKLLFCKTLLADPNSNSQMDRLDDLRLTREPVLVISSLL